MEKRYASLVARLDPAWNGYEAFLKVIDKLDRSSSPGYPLCRQATTVGDWLWGTELFPKPERLAELWLMTQDCLAGTYDHLFKVFVKQEPHTKVKASDKRWRLIIASALPMQVAWAMAVAHHAPLFLSTYGAHPIKFGYIQFGGGWKRRNAEIVAQRKLWCADKSSWDWLSPGWVYEDILELRKRLTRSSTVEWEETMDRLYADAYRDSALLLPDGTVYRQLESGFMKSGLRVTIEDNSFGQDFLHVATCLKLGILVRQHDIDICGDDTQQLQPERPQTYLETLQSFGCKVKHAAVANEFMGCRLSKEGYFPLYVGKHIYNLVRQRDEYLTQTLDSYLRIYAHWAPMFRFYACVADELGVPRKSLSYYQYFADNPEALEGVRLPWVGHLDPVESAAAVI